MQKGTEKDICALRKKRKKIKIHNIIARMILCGFIGSMFIFPHQVYAHFYGHFTGLIGQRMITGEWNVVVMNVLFFLSFLIPLTYRRRASWKESGLVTAFFVSLFIEMYGIPFTILFASRAITPSQDIMMHEAMHVSFANVQFVYTIPMIYGTILMAAGTIIIAYAWITLYHKGKNGELVTTGIYHVSRHPQYLGFILIIIGWMIGWPTIMTLVFGIILIIMYLRVCRKEEQELMHVLDYASYKDATAFMI